MIDCRRGIAAAAAAWVVALAGLAAVLTACGGSGSTGLILPEGIVLEQVRSSDQCVEMQGTSFCPTGSPDGILPQGGYADVTDPLPSPGCDPSTCGATEIATFVVGGFDPGAACAIAAQRARDGRWVTGSLVAVAFEPMQLVLPLPIEAEDASDVVLLCYETAPTTFPAELAMLVDAHADIVFVPGAPGASEAP
jgi:hypothetical protein